MDPVLDPFRDRHHQGATINRIGPNFGKKQCDFCCRVWPCDAALLLVEADRLNVLLLAEYEDNKAAADAYTDGFVKGAKRTTYDAVEAVKGLQSWGSIHSCWDDHEGPNGSHLDGTPCDDYNREVVDRVEVLAVLGLDR